MPYATALRLDEPCVADATASRWLDEASYADDVLWTNGVVVVIAGTAGLRSTLEAATRVAAATARFPCVSAYRVDVEQQPALSTLMRVELMPTVVLYRAGAEIGRLEGLRSVMVYELAIETAVTAPVGAER